MTILDKVRALLNLAESTTIEAERDVFVSKAQSLMQTHAISEADLEAHKPQDQRIKPIMVKTEIWDDYIKARVHLFSVVARANRCKLVYCKQRRKKEGSPVSTIWIFGMPEDIEYTRTLYKSLKVQMDRDMRAHEVPYWEDGKSFRNSFIHGFSEAIGIRLTVANVQAEREARATLGEEKVTNFGLMTVNRNEVIKKLVEAEVGETRTVQNTNSSYAGRNAGNASGKKATIAKGTLSGAGTLR
jgi:hypothetical protein